MQTDNEKVFNEICYFKFRLNEIIEMEKNIYRKEKAGKTFYFSFWSWYRTIPYFLLAYIITIFFFIAAATSSYEINKLINIIIASALTVPIVGIFLLDLFKLFYYEHKILRLKTKINELLTQYYPYDEVNFSEFLEKIKKSKSTIVYSHFLNQWVSLEFRCKPCK
ncbi:hypothetical protein [Proteus mirabilis]|uniref:hypothetical protein n=1 Tax=Proteus mirabilis TaxID=584 RepID=UPI000D853767|nr:hypothetical protein [Proteus mirabilis]EMA4642798.1 hypothetical protein [Proteus mirabilis]MBG5962196.1 hypothetical protein [Proteus mirabilis]MBL1397241.1 hypothetical protein [Proteus mirabilis]MBQ0656128.1 hypothetical protein [Proteus mirabilis]WVJ28443.1 hypothetical protein V1228_18780 [Proteus mirabilis]